MARFCRLLPVIFLLLLVMPAYAQDTTPWELVLYVDIYGSYGDFASVNSQSLTDINPGTDPDVYLVNLFGEQLEVLEGRLAPDNNTFVLNTRYLDQDRSPGLVWGTLSGGTYFTREVAPFINAVNLGDFSPDGRWFSYSWVGGDSADGARTGGVVAFELVFDEFEETGFAQLSIDEVFRALPELTAGPWASMGRWVGEGIRFSPTCYACDPPQQGEYAVWDPFTGTVSLSGGEQFTLNPGTRLDATGEVAAVAFDPAFPAAEQVGPVPIPNVVRYSPSGDINGADSRVIFHDPNISNLMAVHWVNDGQALLVELNSRDRWVLIGREGTVSTQDGTLGIRFLAGSPEGWFTLYGDEEGATYIRHYNDLGISANEVSYIPGGDALVMRALVLGLGITVTASDFPALSS